MEDLVREVNETAMGIRPSSSSRRKSSKLKSNLEHKLQTLKYGGKQHSYSNRMIKPPSSNNCNNSTGSSMPEPSSVRGKRKHREMNKTDHNADIIKPSLQLHNDPRLDHPYPSVSNNFYRQNEKKQEVDFY
jgi:hypothetical protein